MNETVTEYLGTMKLRTVVQTQEKKELPGGALWYDITKFKGHYHKNRTTDAL